MMALPRPPWAPERLDQSGHAHHILARSLRDVAHANHWFGGTRSLRIALRPFLAPGETISLLDVGTGSSEVLLDLVRWAARRGVTIHPVGLDAHREILAVARERAPRLPLVHADMRALPFRSRSVDLVLATLVLHHIPDDAQVCALRELSRVARRGVIVAELERHHIHWLGAKLLAATIWRSPLTRHDAPVSVARGYTRQELEALARDAGVVARARRFWFYRLVLTAAAAEERAAASSTVKA
jgi:ubiquinone/menaquinone biosynthesis C-methylase UbiE